MIQREKLGAVTIRFQKHNVIPELAVVREYASAMVRRQEGRRGEESKD
jgi:hypothetical protein